MDYSYEDFYSSYKDVHNNAKYAYDKAYEKEVSKHLIANAEYLKNVITKCKINQTGDNVIYSYNKALDSMIKKIEKINKFSRSYSQAELAYTYLKEQLDILKVQDGELKTLIANKPSNTDTKYVISGTDPVEYDNSAYSKDLSSWQNRVINLKTKNSNMALTIADYLDYLEKVDACNPLEGEIGISISQARGEVIPDSYQFEENKPKSNIELLPDEYQLTGTELKIFLDANNIPNADYVAVYRRTVVINGININTYAVYDTDCSEKENENFKNYIERNLYYEGKINGAVLSRIFNSDGPPCLIFEQTYRCDGGSLSSGEFNGAAYCNSENRNIVNFYHESNDDYYFQSIVHETGHAFDFTLRYESTGEKCCGITGYKDSTVDDNVSSLYILDAKGSPYTWDRIIRDEVNYFDSSHADYPCMLDFDSEEQARDFFNKSCINGKMSNLTQRSDGRWVLEVNYENPAYSSGITIDGGSSPYDVHDYVNAPHEYFADAFQAYWIGDGSNTVEGGMSRLEFLCPETYKALDRLIQLEINNQSGGGK